MVRTQVQETTVGLVETALEFSAQRLQMCTILGVLRGCIVSIIYDFILIGKCCSLSIHARVIRIVRNYMPLLDGCIHVYIPYASMFEMYRVEVQADYA